MLGIVLNSQNLLPAIDKTFFLLLKFPKDLPQYKLTGGVLATIAYICLVFEGL